MEKKEKMDIENVAAEYQQLNRQIKELNSKMKPLKSQLVDYATEHQAEMDGAFQLKFECGTYISLRVSDVLEGSDEAKETLMHERNEFMKVDLDEKSVLKAQAKDSRLRKLLTKLGLKIGQKETYAVYAN